LVTRRATVGGKIGTEKIGTEKIGTEKVGTEKSA
jgi:hypothetical protein